MLMTKHCGHWLLIGCHNDFPTGNNFVVVFWQHISSALCVRVNNIFKFYIYLIILRCWNERKYSITLKLQNHPLDVNNKRWPKIQTYNSFYNNNNNQEQDIPIEIATPKLLEWLESRKIVQKNWQGAIRDVRSKITNALNDMPVHQELVKLLSGACKCLPFTFP